jgi:hypothetical protein
VVRALPFAAALMAAALYDSRPASAQQTPPVLVATEIRRWDVAAQIGWLGSDKSEIGAGWDDWANAPAGGVAVGRFFTAHVKAEIYSAVSGEGLVYGVVATPVEFPFAPIPSEHYIRTAAVGIGLSYQWFDNQWFHPFVGAGGAVLREHHRMVAVEQFTPTRDPRGPVPIPVVTTTSSVSYAGRPFLVGGFKWYPTERAFFRTDLRTLFSSHGVAELVWTAGMGADL